MNIGTINKATAAAITSALIMLVNKYAGLGLNDAEQGLATAGIVGLVVWLVPNIEPKGPKQ